MNDSNDFLQRGITLRQPWQLSQNDCKQIIMICKLTTYFKEISY